ncbi:hypothetical protein FHP25_11505 [Vineibacter terrae]|uniref:Uncharacterized protein n=1 Tax=Vineibacter terrae TaxID=2586908 RepID=A0A5C8PPD2_9HYPH|nr:hypothetical protein [Vineibacter terrae]TXL76805.1 hypothetical protein FHP25_11505 [Vineibacter terrae]
MAIDFKSLKKLESLPASAQAGRIDDNQRFLVLVKLRDSGKRPDYVTPRSEIGSQMFSAEIEAAELKALEADPAVESVSISRRIPLVK